MGRSALWNLESNLHHGFFKKLPILRLLYCMEFCPDEFNPEPIKNPRLGEFYRNIERSLTAQRGKKGLRALLPDYLTNDFRDKRLYVCSIGKPRVGHNGCWIAVYKDNLIAFFSQGFTGLSTRIIKLTRLPYYDWASTYDKYLFYVSP